MLSPTSPGNSTIGAALRCSSRKNRSLDFCPGRGFFVPRLAQHPILKFPKKKTHMGLFILNHKSYYLVFSLKVKKANAVIKPDKITVNILTDVSEPSFNKSNK